ncbi:MAG: hypothetical protein WAK98_14505 [Gemmobacter sp.]
MNQTFQPGTVESVEDKALPLPPPLATRRDIEALANALIKGENAVVRRRDLAELMRRLTAILDERAAAADAAQEARIARLDRRLDSVEGALRIELAPMIGKIVAQEIASAPPARPGLARGLVLGLSILLAFALGLTAASFYRSGIYDFSVMTSMFVGSSGDIAPFSSPNGGIEARGNHLK